MIITPIISDEKALYPITVANAFTPVLCNRGKVTSLEMFANGSPSVGPLSAPLNQHSLEGWSSHMERTEKTEQGGIVIWG